MEDGNASASAERGNSVAGSHNVVVPDKTIKEVSRYDGTLRVHCDNDSVCFVEVGNPFRVGFEVDIKS